MSAWPAQSGQSASTGPIPFQALLPPLAIRVDGAYIRSKPFEGRCSGHAELRALDRPPPSSAFSSLTASFCLPPSAHPPIGVASEASVVQGAALIFRLADMPRPSFHGRLHLHLWPMKCRSRRIAAVLSYLPPADLYSMPTRGRLDSMVERSVAGAYEGRTVGRPLYKRTGFGCRSQREHSD